METSYGNLAKVHSNCSGIMTKMATIPVYGIKLLKLLQDQKVYNLGLGIYIYMIGDMGSTKFAQMIILG